MFGARRFVLVPVALAIAQPAPAQLAPFSLPRALEDTHCPTGADSAIVVCGRRDPSRYRIPESLRDDGPIDARSESPVAARREADSLDRYGAQTVGPGGYLQHSRQVDCDWRVARQTLQGRQPDCTVRIQPDQPTDWQRR